MGYDSDIDDASNNGNSQGFDDGYDDGISEDYYMNKKRKYKYSDNHLYIPGEPVNNQDHIQNEYIRSYILGYESGYKSGLKRNKFLQENITDKLLFTISNGTKEDIQEILSEKRIDMSGPIKKGLEFANKINSNTTIKLLLDDNRVTKEDIVNLVVTSKCS